MQVTATQSPLSEADRHNLGGELGATLFVAGLRVFVPERACVEDIEHMIDGLQRLVLAGGYERRGS